VLAGLIGSITEDGPVQQQPSGGDGTERQASATATAPVAPVRVREMEVKLQGAPADLARIVHLPLVEAVRQGPAQRVRQVTTYSDTPELDLLRRGLALRTREQDGQRRHGVKTLSSGAEMTGIAGRDEWEWAAPPAGLAPPAELAGVLDEALQGRLVPLFRTDVRRTLVTVAPDLLTLIEIAVDIGHVAVFGPDGGQTLAQLSEVELELKAGRAAELLEFAALLQDQLPLRLTLRSKADTALALRGIRLPAAPPAPPLFTPATTVADAFRSTLRHALSAVLAAEDAVRTEVTTETVAALRDAVQQAAAVLALFRPLLTDPHGAMLRRQARAMMRPLQRLAACTALEAAADGGAADPLALARRRACARLDKALRAPAWRGFVLQAAAWLEAGGWREGAEGRLEQPAATRIPALLECRLQKVRGAGPATAGRRARRRLARRLAAFARALALFRDLGTPSPMAAPAAAALAEAAGDAAGFDRARRLAQRLRRHAGGSDRGALDAASERLRERRRKAVARLAALARR
jgi:inorganic triphosphatase YgiF